MGVNKGTYHLRNNVVEIDSTGGKYLCWRSFQHDMVQQVEVGALGAPLLPLRQPHTGLGQQKHYVGHE